ncbi:hypothetical protein E3O55_09885 [Cryobacterium sp. MDB1-18-2]|uniref:hypothetical protein n=1 Tax=unclassified Cryobacterium TaxID=2649013 RepID=UPI001069B4B7|nr:MULTISPECIES: hypothetical protein [unclassified Cryobacterium]TFC29175.1 hypothetical protein E3O55_09885 [Cryobacterium sp. MDB1-18-2]TFC45537.1 hypothetical protein E3O50_03555 [Cryobacterium sp. MDB1-18-1]
MTPNAEARTWTYSILALFAEAVQVGELSTGLDILAGLNESQLVDVINISVTVLDRGMDGQKSPALPLVYQTSAVSPFFPPQSVTFAVTPVPLAASLSLSGTERRMHSSQILHFTRL